MSTIKKILILITIITTIILLSINTTAQVGECTTSLPVCYSHDVTETGFGAVQICGECAVCGKPDGICPEDYTDGNNETDENKTRILLKISKEQRPSSIQDNAPSIFNEYTGSETGHTACQSIHPEAQCVKMFWKEKFNESWTELGSSVCNLQISGDLSDNRYWMAECEGIKRTAGCQWCNDPDCTANLTGLVWDASTNKSTGEAKVTVTSHYNYLIERITNPTSEGLYSMNKVPTGNVKVTCTKTDYRPLTKETFIQPGTNVVDCPLKEAYCTPECTIPNDEGTEVCRERCKGVNGCNFQEHTSEVTGKTYDASTICENLEPGARVNLEWQDPPNNTQMLYVDCCNQDFGIREVDAMQIQSNNNIKNLITRTYKKTLKGEPVDVKILIYEKN